jgi:hypothetical protein
VIVSRPLAPAAAAAEPSTDLGGGLPLPGAPWSLRLARGTRGRPALEVYENGTLLDVMVATPLAAEVLRGARRARRGGRYRALAWGRLLPDGAAVSVTFRRGRIRTASSAAAVTEIGTRFWIAAADGQFGWVSIGYGPAVRCSPARS